MRIAFVNPATEFDRQYHANALPIGLLYLAAAAEQLYGASVDVFDSRHGSALPPPSNVNSYDVIGFTSMSMQVETALELARQLRAAGYQGKLVFGGPHASVAPDHLKQQSTVDAVFIGEAEHTFLQYLAFLEGKPHKLERVWTRSSPTDWVHHPGTTYVEDLDTLPFPAREKYGDLSTRLGFINMTTTRGCPFNCNYCQPTKRLLFGNKVRRRSVDNIMAEIEDAVRRFSITDFSIDDDTFTFHKATVLELCVRLRGLSLNWSCQSRSDIDRETLIAMRDAGCRMLFVGAESGSQRILELMEKRNTVENNAAFIGLCNELGIETWCNMMIGYPGETREDMDLSLKFVSEAAPSRVCVSQVTPFPGTALWQQHHDDVIELDWNDMARHVTRPKFRSMAPYQKIINRYMWLMSKDAGKPLNYDRAGKSAFAHYCARRLPAMHSFMARFHLDYDETFSEALAIARSGQVEQAIILLKRLQRRYPSQTDLCGHLGWLYLSVGQPKEAAHQYRRLLHNQPENAEARLLLAKACMQAGQAAEARRELQKVIAKQPSDEASNLLAELDAAATKH